ncbi:M28 family peptidase [Aquimarina sp. 2201CG1-2-11]|uniref:M28 family peptidase n=1 Tax=Aquimarina discodermiae TaxID=3231043 RepID=UPI0034629E31
MKHIVSRATVLIFVILVSFLSCKSKAQEKTETETSKETSISQKEEITSLFDEAALITRLKELSSDRYEGRKTGEKGNALARTFIINEFKKLNVLPIKDSFEQSFNFSHKNKEYPHAGINVLGKIAGTVHPDKYIVVSAHYDHLGIINDKIYNGADDNASGVAALVSFAEYFKKNPPKHTVILAAFDAEELGLAGAKYFVENMPIAKDDIVLNINMDMISRNINNELYVVGARYNDILKSVLKDFKNPTDIKLSQGHDGSDGKDDWTKASDHGPFHNIDIPFLYFGEEDHPDYHKHTDEFKGVMPVFYTKVVKLIISVFAEVDVTLSKSR